MYQENARLDAVRKKLTQKGDQAALSNQLANAVGIKRRNLDRKLCNGRESQETIVRSYKRLVVSVASGYQGRGLALPDLIQVWFAHLSKNFHRCLVCFFSD